MIHNLKKGKSEQHAFFSITQFLNPQIVVCHIKRIDEHDIFWLICWSVCLSVYRIHPQILEMKKHQGGTQCRRRGGQPVFFTTIRSVMARLAADGTLLVGRTK